MEAKKEDEQQLQVQQPQPQQQPPQQAQQIEKSTETAKLVRKSRRLMSPKNRGKRRLRRRRLKTQDDKEPVEYQWKFVDPSPYVVKAVSSATEAKKNEMMFERILALLLNIRTDIITASNKDHLDKVQQLLQNCVRRMMNEIHRVKKVVFSQRQILIFRATPGLDMGVNDER